MNVLQKRTAILEPESMEILSPAATTALDLLTSRLIHVARHYTNLPDVPLDTGRAIHFIDTLSRALDVYTDALILGAATKQQTQSQEQASGRSQPLEK